MPDWSFRRRLLTGVIVISLLALLTSAASLITSRVLISNSSKAMTSVGHALSDARSLQLLGVRNIADVHACLLSGGTRFAPEALGGGTAVRDLATRMRLEAGDAESRRLLDRILAAQRSQQDSFARALLEPGGSNGRKAPSSARGSGSLLSSSVEFDESMAALVTHAEAVWMLGLSRGRAGLTRVETLLAILALATMLVLSLVCLSLIADLTRRYGLQTSARSLAEHGHTAAMASLSEAEAASHLKDEFLATVSHELRNPLAPILTWTQLLRSGTLDAAKTQRALEVIERNVASQVQLIDDLVDVSRVVSGKFRLDVRPIDLAPVIKAAAESQSLASEAKHIRLQLVLDERAGLVAGDSERLQQVMSNLISNAIKFTTKSGRVQVVLQRAESHLEIVVSDTGIGIAPEFLPHVFEPFRQAVGGSMRRHGGLGLGLSIVRHIVELHGGEISAHSDGVGRGAKFTVVFPILAVASEAGEPIQRHPIAGDRNSDVHLTRLDGVRVILVEDEPSAREALQEMFSSCGAESKAAGSAGEALAILDTWVPDVIVSDIAMPGEDGYSLMRRVRLRSIERGGTVPAVALTAYAKIEDRVTILSSGFQMYLSKPADPNELVAVVGSLAKRRR